MKQGRYKALVAAAFGCAAMWSTQVMAAANQPTGNESQPQIEQLNKEIQQLQQQSQELGQQVQQLKKKVRTLKTIQTQAPVSSSATASKAAAASPPKNKTYLGGAFYLNYGRYTAQGNSGNGDGGFSYASLNANGNYGAMKWAFDERIGPSGQIADKALLHLAWISYDFNKENTVTGGFFQVPYGNYPYGYQTYWGSMGYYTGFNDNQAFGVGYTFKKNNWRWDLDVFKNYDAGQHSLYAANPTGPYRMIDTGNTRLAYTFGKGTGNTVNVSASLRGGHLQINGENGNYGTHWAGALAADAELGDWTLQGQAVLYKYNVPAGMGVSRQSVLMEDYGFPTARLPAAGLMLTVNVARTFNFKHLGPVNSIQPFVDFGYLKSRMGHFDDSPSVTAANGGMPYRMGNIVSVTPGVITTIGPFVLWTEVVLGKNDELRFIGPYGAGSSDVVGYYNNDNQWHARYNIEAAFYFGGNVN